MQGHALWANTYGSAGAEESRGAVIPSSNGGYLMAGSIAAGESQWWLMHVDENGELEYPTCPLIESIEITATDTYVVPIVVYPQVGEAHLSVRDGNALVSDAPIEEQRQCSN